MEERFNSRSPAVKRLMREAEELRNPTEDYFAEPFEGNLFEWHFTVRGPQVTDFEGGIYHGRIVFPTDYPISPPNIIILTPNGRFDTNTKICLSVSGHHPESWQPSWSIRTVLLAIISFMPTPGNGALGSLDYTADERKILAANSQHWVCPECGPISELLSPSSAAQSLVTDSLSEETIMETYPHGENSASSLRQNVSENESNDVAQQIMSETSNVASNDASENPILPGSDLSHDISEKNQEGNAVFDTKPEIGNIQEAYNDLNKSSESELPVSGKELMSEHNVLDGDLESANNVITFNMLPEDLSSDNTMTTVQYTNDDLVPGYSLFGGDYLHPSNFYASLISGELPLNYFFIPRVFSVEDPLCPEKHGISFKEQFSNFIYSYMSVILSKETDLSNRGTVQRIELNRPNRYVVAERQAMEFINSLIITVPGYGNIRSEVSRETYETLRDCALIYFLDIETPDDSIEPEIFDQELANYMLYFASIRLRYVKLLNPFNEMGHFKDSHDKQMLLHLAINENDSYFHVIDKSALESHIPDERAGSSGSNNAPTLLHAHREQNYNQSGASPVNVERFENKFLSLPLPKYWKQKYYGILTKRDVNRNNEDEGDTRPWQQNRERIMGMQNIMRQRILMRSVPGRIQGTDTEGNHAQHWSHSSYVTFAMWLFAILFFVLSLRRLFFLQYE